MVRASRLTAILVGDHHAWAGERGKSARPGSGGDEKAARALPGICRAGGPSVTRESAAAKSARYLAEGRLTITLVSGDHVTAVCKGSGESYQLGHEPGRGWQGGVCLLGLLPVVMRVMDRHEIAPIRHGIETHGVEIRDDNLVAGRSQSFCRHTRQGAIEALRDTENATEHMVQEFARRREQFARDLNRVPGFRCVPPEGAFYAWVNIEETGVSAEEVCRIMLEEGGVAGIPGAAFGASGAKFVRFSFASSAAILREAVERIQKVSSEWQGTAAIRN